MSHLPYTFEKKNSGIINLNNNYNKLCHMIIPIATWLNHISAPIWFIVYNYTPLLNQINKSN